MLATLKNADISERPGLLANAALAMHRDPAFTQFWLPEDDHLKPLIEEAAYELNIDLRQLSDKDRMRLAKMFSGTFKKLVLDNKSRRAARDRLAQKGALSLEGYVIRDSELLKKRERLFGIDVKAVRDTLRSPSSYQHLVPDTPELESRDQISLFVKYFGDPRNRDFHWILADAKRDKNVIHALSAWKIYKADLEEGLDLTHASPLDLLAAFTNVFGLPIRVGDGQPETLMLYRRIPISNADVGIDIVSGISAENTTTSFMLRKNADPPSVDIAIAFCIDNAKYLDALKQHEVDAEQEVDAE